MASTYEPIATTTLSSAAASITFSSISSAYTDLRIVLNMTASIDGGPYMQFNSDTATNYSVTNITGNGTSALSARGTNLNKLWLDYYGTTSTTIPTFYSADIFSYSGSTYKTCLNTGQTDINGSGSVSYTVGLWRSTSAITSIVIQNSNGNLNAGTTATLYGILKA